MIDEQKLEKYLNKAYKSANDHVKRIEEESKQTGDASGNYMDYGYYTGARDLIESVAMVCKLKLGKGD